MDNRLRRNHFFIWIAILFFVVPTFILAIQLAPQKVSGDSYPYLLVDRLPEELFSSEDNWIRVAILGNETNDEHQIEVLLKQPVKAPFVKIKLKLLDQQESILGRLDNNNLYRFPININLLDTDAFSIVLFDEIKKEVIHTLNAKQ